MINYEFPPIGGGGGVAAANLAAELVNRGHDVDYITTHYPGFKRQENWKGVRLFREPVLARKDLHTASIISMLSYPPVAINRGLKLARQKKYDIIHTHFAIPSGPAGYYLSRKLKTPHVLSVYGGDIYDPSKPYSPHTQPVLKRVVKRVLNQADVIVGESSDICEKAIKYYSPRTTPQRIPLGLVPPQFKSLTRAELGMQEDVIYAIAVSRLIERKDYPTLIKAVASADIENLKLIVIGDGPKLYEMKALIEQLQIKDKVIFKGSVDNPTKFAYLTAADFFALTPLHEGYGIVYQEAMYCGLPIVTTNVGGHTDFLIEGRNALLADTGDVKGMAKSFSSICENEGLRNRMRTCNLEDITKQTIDFVAHQYERAYEILL